MTKQGSRQLLLLVLFLGVVIVVVMARRADSPVSPAATPAARRTRAAAPPAPAAAVADVKLDLLKPPATNLDPAIRNPFQFKAKAAPAPTVFTSREPAIVAPLPPPGPPPLPPIALKYIGVLDTAQGRLAVFRDNGGNIVNGKEGDIIEGRYRLLKIGVESADLAYLDGRGRQTVRLSGQ